MSWFMVNGISAFSALLSLGIFIITTHKLAKTIRLGRELAMHIQSATASLDQACSALHEEHQNFRDENRTLEARIGESVRVRRDIERSLNHMEQLHIRLQKKFAQQATAVSLRHPSQTVHRAAPFRQQQNNLPVFVQRKVSKATLNNGSKF